MSEMIQSVLISGKLDDARLCRALGELADLGALPTEICKLVIVIDSNGGGVTALHSFVESISDDPRTRAAVEKADVKIYNAQSAAVLVALTFGSHREMVRGSELGIHLPNIFLSIGDVDRDNRISPSLLGDCRTTIEMVEALIDRYGLHDRKSEIYTSGWLRVTAQECLRRGLVHGLFSTGRDDSSEERSGEASSPTSQSTQTILISGRLTQELLDRALWELKGTAATPRPQNVVFLVDSPGGSATAVVSFLESVKQDEVLREIAERAGVKIYDAGYAAALLAFSLGNRHELYRRAKVAFHLGEVEIQMGDPAHIDTDGRVSAAIIERWHKYHSMVVEVAKRLELFRDPSLNAELLAGGVAAVAPEQLLRCGAVSRLF